MAASGVTSGKDVVAGDVEVHEDIDELLSETVRKFCVLYDKTLKTVVVVVVVVVVLVVVIIINKFTLKYLHISLASP